MKPISILSVALMAATFLQASVVAQAHPLGNNTVNRAAVIEVSRDRVSVRHLTDMAEIPTLLAMQTADENADGEVSAAEWNQYARERGEETGANIALSANGEPAILKLEDARWALRPGVAGLQTLWLDFRFSTALPYATTTRLDYLDRSQPQAMGWKEVTAIANEGTLLLQTDVPSDSPSALLSNYPQDRSTVPNIQTAHLELRVEPKAESSQAHPVVTDGGGQEGLSVPVPKTKAKASVRETSPTAGAATTQARITPRSVPETTPSPAVASGSRLGEFFRLGVHHIATGWDHLVFLLGLLAAHRARRELVWVITAFTGAHSLTLGLAASGLVTPPGSWVEPAIALTIAYVGLANLSTGLKHGVALAFGFGLIHGFGFAGALAENLGDAAMQGHGWLLDLAAFNLGIEAFQLGLIVTLIPLLALLGRLVPSDRLRRLASMGVLAAGVGWFLARL